MGSGECPFNLPSCWRGEVWRCAPRRAALPRELQPRADLQLRPRHLVHVRLDCPPRTQATHTQCNYTTTYYAVPLNRLEPGDVPYCSYKTGRFYD